MHFLAVRKNFLEICLLKSFLEIFVLLNNKGVTLILNVTVLKSYVKNKYCFISQTLMQLTLYVNQPFIEFLQSLHYIQ